MIESLLKTSLAVSETADSGYRVRPSCLPYCALQHIHYSQTGQSIDGETALYTSIGTVVHVVLQRYMGNSGRVWGNWKCNTCGRTVECQTGPQYCNRTVRCKNGEMHYQEFEVKYRHPTNGQTMSGRIDGVVEVSNELWVLDYKTTSMRKIRENAVPFSKNRHQCRVYVALAVEQIAKHIGLPLAGYILAYIPRDDPTTSLVKHRRMDKQQRLQALLLLNSYLEQQRLAKMYLRTGKRSTLTRLIEDRVCPTREAYTRSDYYPGCPLEAVCLSRDPQANLIQALM